MRAAVVQELVGPDGVVITEVEEPQGAHWLSPDERVLVEVHAAAFSFPDLLQTRGLYQQGADPPYVLGGEIAGIVREAPPGCAVAVGDRVAGLVRRGAVADVAVAPPEYLLHLPDEVGFAAGAALYINYTTAVFGLRRAEVVPEDHVLVQGAAGGVGTAAIQVIRAAGARSIALVSSDEKAAAVERLGADHILRSDGDWVAGVRELTGGEGADIVLDMVGGDRFPDSLAALRPGGRLVVVGFAGGSIPVADTATLLQRNLALVGISMDVYEEEHPGTVARTNREVEDLMARGAIDPLIAGRYPLHEAAEALRVMDRRGAIGKLVVDVRP